MSEGQGERLRDTEMREAGKALEGKAERDKGWVRQHRRQTCLLYTSDAADDVSWV